MVDQVPWFSNLISALCTDYSSYNKVISVLIDRSSRPLKSSLNDILIEEKRLSRRIIRQEEIIHGWLEEAPILAEKAENYLKSLSALRKESALLRMKGSESLKAGMAVLEKERSRIGTRQSIKSNRKEAAPRLIDIKL